MLEQPWSWAIFASRSMNSIFRENCSPLNIGERRRQSSGVSFSIRARSNVPVSMPEAKGE
jgi:hypothetical protein